MPVPYDDRFYYGVLGQTPAVFKHCYPRIHHRDISSYLYLHGPQLTDTDRRQVQEGITLNLSESDWVWEDAELIMYLSARPVVFYSGTGTNKFVVHLDAANVPAHEVEHKGWSLWFRDRLISLWGWVTSATRVVSGYVTGWLAITA